MEEGIMGTGCLQCRKAYWTSIDKLSYWHTYTTYEGIYRMMSVYCICMPPYLVVSRLGNVCFGSRWQAAIPSGHSGACVSMRNIMDSYALFKLPYALVRVESTLIKHMNQACTVYLFIIGVGTNTEDFAADRQSPDCRTCLCYCCDHYAPCHC